MSEKKTKALGARRPQDWSAAKKLAAVAGASGLPDDDLGAFLRERGLRQTQLEQWKARMLEGLAPQRRKPSSETQRLRSLERELRRKDKALAEASALLVLKKKPRRSGGRAGMKRAEGHTPAPV